MVLLETKTGSVKDGITELYKKKKKTGSVKDGITELYKNKNQKNTHK